MISIKRLPEPESLKESAAQWKTEYLQACSDKEANPSEANKKKKKAAEKKYAQADVKADLKTMFHSKCGFCERKRDYPHIEHFHPKNIYPDKCFKWENLILACEVCNGPEYKGVKFPVATDGTPLFINPCNIDPSIHFDFICEEDKNHEHGFIAVIKPKTEAGKVTEKEIGLNRPNLLEERTDFLITTFFTALKAGEGDAEAISILRKACKPRFIFSAFAKTLYRQYVEKV